MDKAQDLIYTVHRKLLADDVTMYRSLRPSTLIFAIVSVEAFDERFLRNTRAHISVIAIAHATSPNAA